MVVLEVPEADTPQTASATSSAEPVGVSGADPGFRGRWEGTGLQNDGQSWPIVVNANGNHRGECATAEYPTIRCTAVWFCTAEDADGTVRGREQLTDGLDRCIDSGTLSMRLTESGELQMSWQGDGITAEATLRRAE